MSKIKYITDWGKDDIKSVDILRETEKCVYIAYGDEERRVNKMSDWNNYHDSWDEAHRFLMTRSNNSVEAAEKRFKNACDKRLKVEALIDPDK